MIQKYDELAKLQKKLVLPACPKLAQGIILCFIENSSPCDLYYNDLVCRCSSSRSYLMITKQRALI